MNFKKQVLKSITGVKLIPLEYRKYSNLDHSTRVIVSIDADKIFVPDDYKLSDMAFEDMFVSKGLSTTDPQGEVKVFEDGLLLHVFRLSSDKIGVATITTEFTGKSYYMTACYELDVNTSNMELKWCIPNYRKFALQDMEKCRLDALCVLVLTATYEREVAEVKLPHSIAKLPLKERESYKEYTIDLSKPRYVSSAKGGSHSSPVEHERRGHFRTSKNGKRYFVRSTIVNEGKVGKVSKEYKFN